jgi:hypothetical protein
VLLIASITARPLPTCRPYADPVDPLNVATNGTRHVHAVWDGAGFLGGAGGAAVTLRTLDAPVLSPGDTGHLLWYDGAEPPNLAGGVHVNVYNNVWGTGEGAGGGLCTPASL